MGYNSKQLLKDGTAKTPIPQMFDRANDAFVPLEKMEYYGKSTDTKPSPTLTPKGATFVEIDTKLVFMNDGSAWVVW